MREIGAGRRGYARRALALAVIVELTDLLDGKIARRLGVASRRGNILDSSIDHLSRTAVLGVLASEGLVPRWVAATALYRNGCVMALRALEQDRTGEFPRTQTIGKLKGASEGVLIITTLLAASSGWRTTQRQRTAGALVVSGFHIASTRSAFRDWRLADGRLS